MFISINIGNKFRCKKVLESYTKLRLPLTNKDYWVLHEIATSSNTTYDMLRASLKGKVGSN
jgi:hypothetical protein